MAKLNETRVERFCLNHGHIVRDDRNQCRRCGMVFNDDG